MKEFGQSENRKFFIEEVVRELERGFIRQGESELYRVIAETVEKPLIEVVLKKPLGTS